MPVTYQYHAESNTIESEATGVVTTGEILAYVRSILADDRIKTGFIEILNCEPVDDLILTYTEVEPFKELWQLYLRKGCRATLILAPSDTSYGTMRMLQTVIGLSQEDAADRFVVVRSRDELDARLSSLGT